MKKPALIRWAAMAGIAGPILFAVVVTGLTIVQSDFMRTLGWHPLGPVIDWPSGLALGPYGWLMTATFFVCGALMAFFAYGLQLALNEKIATTLLMIAGLAMMGLIASTDRTLSAAPRTWHGLLHDGFFALLGFTMMPGMLLLGRVFQKNEHWKKFAIYIWGTLAFVIPTFWLKGVAFYVFLLAILTWSIVIAFRLRATQ
ncbi:MAG TPA: DUF998 domain-containing protein [Anaerolineales bacterium]